MKTSTFKQLERKWREQSAAISKREFNAATKDAQSRMLFEHYKAPHRKAKKHFRIPNVVRKMHKIEWKYGNLFTIQGMKLIKPNRVVVFGNSGKPKQIKELI